MNHWLIRAVMFAQAGRQRASYDEGLTLIELLISIIILGILSAIAIPSFIGISFRARHAEAQTYVSSVLHAQQAYYIEYGDFAPDIPSLGQNIPNSPFYTYSISSFSNHQTLDGESVDGIEIEASPLSNVRGYMGKVWVENSPSIQLKTIMCEGELRQTSFMGTRTYCP